MFSSGKICVTAPLVESSLSESYNEETADESITNSSAAELNIEEEIEPAQALENNEEQFLRTNNETAETGRRASILIRTETNSILQIEPSNEQGLFRLSWFKYSAENSNNRISGFVDIAKEPNKKIENSYDSTKVNAKRESVKPSTLWYIETVDRTEAEEQVVDIDSAGQKSQASLKDGHDICNSSLGSKNETEASGKSSTFWYINTADSENDCEDQYFGTNLETVKKHSELRSLPKIVVDCITVLESESSIKTPGLYRVSGFMPVMEGFKKESKSAKPTVTKPKTQGVPLTTRIWNFLMPPDTIIAYATGKYSSKLFHQFIFIFY